MFSETGVVGTKNAGDHNWWQKLKHAKETWTIEATKKENKTYNLHHKNREPDTETKTAVVE